MNIKPTGSCYGHAAAARSQLRPSRHAVLCLFAPPEDKARDRNSRTTPTAHGSAHSGKSSVSFAHLAQMMPEHRETRGDKHKRVSSGWAHSGKSSVTVMSSGQMMVAFQS